jgi:hypothetical protein
MRVLLFFTLFFASCAFHQNIDRSISSRKKAVSENVVAGFGNTSCLVNGNTKDLNSLSVSVRGANRKEKNFVTDIISTITDMAGEVQAKILIQNMKINFKKYLRQRTDGHCLPGNFGLTTRGAIDLARKCHPKSPEKNITFSTDHLRGSLIHEIGHVVGNRVFRGRTFYSLYNSQVKKVCKVSKYTTHSNAGNKHRNRNEEFAEVWASYIYATDRLKKKCRSSYNFMREVVFNGSSHTCKALRF